jgi:hypothetical protein
MSKGIEDMFEQGKAFPIADIAEAEKRVARMCEHTRRMLNRWLDEGCLPANADYVLQMPGEWLMRLVFSYDTRREVVGVRTETR